MGSGELIGTLMLAHLLSAVQEVTVVREAIIWLDQASTTLKDCPN
jgi:hypothetical protein